MARSVSVPSGAAWVVYLRPERDGETSGDWGTSNIDSAGGWDDFILDVRNVFHGACGGRNPFPSLQESGHWVGREDRAILENEHAYIGVSEYCGLVSLWCVPKESGYGELIDLAAHWCVQIEKRVRALALRAWPGLVLDRIGGFSNGEAIFALANTPGSCITSKEGRLW